MSAAAAARRGRYGPGGRQALTPTNSTAYRLCRIPPKRSSAEALTEECFQAGHLEFAGDQQCALQGRRLDSLACFQRVTYTDADGKQWARNPVPACAGFGGGYANSDPHCGNQGGMTQFPPPLPGLHGFGGWGLQSEAGPHPGFGFSIVDTLRLPADLEPGQYALSWRWDAEQTNQVWAHCASVEVTAPGSGAGRAVTAIPDLGPAAAGDGAAAFLPKMHHGLETPAAEGPGLSRAGEPARFRRDRLPHA